ncbi:hypothetical protein [Aristaeella lactis]|uniref:hypothetical protein n=1 Tax=Aristaeella lactis TaxID=3046383 RepID=UPI001BB5A7F5|nr:hypothetical protein [Aristaeella lactis]QUA53198.1 hypothetical protein JYE50_00810 [Aristaeella lactis]
MNSDEANEQLSDSITIAEGTGTVAFVNTYTKKTVDITVDKIWSLAEANSAVVCDATNVTWPAGTTVSVKLQKKVGDGEVKDVEGDDATATLSAAHPSHTFEDLVEYEGDQKVTYSVKEVAIEGTYAANFNLGSAEKQDDGSYRITNSEKEAGLTITKSFGDSDLTDAQKGNIVFKVTGNGLKKDGTAVSELTKKYSDFTGDPKKWVLTQADGIMDGVTYTVSETADSVEITGYNRTTTVKVNSDEANEQLSDSITIAEGTGTVAFVNTYTKKTVDITVDKIWSLAEANSAVVCDATNVTWPAGTTVSVKLQKKVGDGEVKDVEGDDATATLSAAHPSHTFEDLVEYEGDQKVTYSVKEVAIEGTYAANFNLGSAEKQDDGSYRITNSEKEAGLTITKSFGDSDLTDAQKGNIVFKVTGNGLKKDGTAVSELTKKYSDFTGDPKKWVLTQADGIMDGVTYTVSETADSVEITGYNRTTTVKVNSDEANEQLSDSITIAEGTGTVAFVNTYTKKTVNITVDKIWSLAEANSAVVCDATNVTWPAGTTVSVKLQKKVGDGEVKDVEGDDATATLSAAHPSHTFEDLVEYEGDQKVTYSVKEVAIEGTYAANFNLGSAEKQDDGSYRITNSEKEAGLTITKSFGDSDLTDAQKGNIVFKVTGNGLKKDGTAVSELTKKYSDFTGDPKKWVLTQADGIMDGVTYTVSETADSVEITQVTTGQRP